MTTSIPWDDGPAQPPGVFDRDEALRCAKALANRGFAVFPCSANKRPSRPKSEDGSKGGFHDASRDLGYIEFLWRNWPGPLVGVATGAASNVSVLDIDIKHSEARAWWHRYYEHLPRTRTYRTRGGGIHLYMHHSHGVRCTEGRGERLGVDTRGTGGYCVFWYGAGLECLDHAPLAAWPVWLSQMIWPPARPPVPVIARVGLKASPAGINGLIRVVRTAEEGTRNGRLNWSAFKMREHITRGSVTPSEAKQILLEAAGDAGLPAAEAARTIASALGGPAA